MDDFRIGSVPAPDPYSHHQQGGSNARKRRQHHEYPDGDPPEEPVDTFEHEVMDEVIEDTYTPSDLSHDR